MSGTLQSRVAMAMAARGLSRTALGARAGLSGAYVTHLLGGRIGGPGLLTVVALAKGLGVTVEWLVTGAGSPGDLAPFPRDEKRVYFIRRPSDGAIKIGVSSRPLARLANLQSGSAERLELVASTPGSWATERELHRRFRTHRLVGEWFATSADLVATISRLTSEAA